MGGGQAVHDWWTLVRVAATKLQLQLGAVRVAATNVYELQPLGLHNKFTKIYKLHKNFKKIKNFLVILRIDFFKNL